MGAMAISARERRWKQARIEELRRWLTRADSWKQLPGYAGATFPGLKDGDRKAEEFIRFIRVLVAEEPLV